MAKDLGDMKSCKRFIWTLETPENGYGMLLGENCYDIVKSLLFANNDNDLSFYHFTVYAYPLYPTDDSNSCSRPLSKLLVSKSQDWSPMDLETENRLAALLMEEARRLRQQADKEGVGIYLRDPKVRGRPNSRFLTATVLGVQQANRAVEVNEMWRAREKELELDNKLSHRSKDTAKYGGERYHGDLSKGSTSLKRGKPSAGIPVSQSSRKHKHRDLHSEEHDGLKDEEVEEFLQSRMKRGRGAIGSRMDDPGPYPVCSSSDQDELLPVTLESNARHEGKRQVLGPQKPSWLLTDEQHKVSPGRKSAEEDHASRSKRRQSEDKYTHRKSKEKRRKEKSRHHHEH